MFERYPQESAQALFLAMASAVAARADFIGPDHMLAGALGTAPHLGLPCESILRRLRLEAPTLPPGPNRPDIEFSQVVKRLLQGAMAVADRLGHHRIRPEHMLLALLEEPDCPAGEALRGAGCERQRLVESAAHAASVDDSPLAYSARPESRIVPGTTASTHGE